LSKVPTAEVPADLVVSEASAVSVDRLPMVVRAVLHLTVVRAVLHLTTVREDLHLTVAREDLRLTMVWEGSAEATRLSGERAALPAALGR